MDNKDQINETKKSVSILLVILIVIVLIGGATFAYLAFSATNTNITGNAGTVNLSVSVTKVLPNTVGTDNILVTTFADLPTSLNSSCIDSNGEYALCQLYKVTLTNGTGGVNTNVKGSVSFNNANTPNLSWILLGNTYSSSTNYTAEMLGSTFNTASSEFTNFVDSYLLTSGNSVDYYILVWVNESDTTQTDEGTYSGTVRFEDTNGKGVTSTFSSAS